MAEAGPEGRRPKSRRRSDGELTRGRLLAAGIELMAEGGPAAVTLVAAARGAGVSRGTAHHHFASRAALLDEVKAGVGQELLKLAGGEHHFHNPFGLALRLAVEDQSIVRSRIYHILEDGPLRDARTLNLLSRLAEMEAAGDRREGVDGRSAALISAALDFAGLMAMELGRTVEERRELTRRLSETWRVMFTHGALRTSPAE
jgi:AcrR family transcriptional regulator